MQTLNSAAAHHFLLVFGFVICLYLSYNYCTSVCSSFICINWLFADTLGFGYLTSFQCIYYQVTCVLHSHWQSLQSLTWKLRNVSQVVPAVGLLSEFDKLEIYSLHVQ